VSRCDCATVRLVAALAACWGCSSGKASLEAEAGVELHPSARRIRLLVSDSTEASVSVLDLEDEEWVARMALAEPAALVLTEQREHALLVQPEAGRVQLLWSGVSALDHSEGFDSPHVHVYKFEPELLSFSLEAPSPRHVVARHGVVSLLYGDLERAELQWFDEAALSAPLPPAVRSFPLPAAAGAAQLAVPERQAFVTASAGDPSGPGVMLVDAEGVATLLAPCSEPAALANIRGYTIFACGGALVSVGSDSEDEPLRSEQLELPGNERARWLSADEAWPVLLVGAESGRLFAYERELGWRELKGGGTSCFAAVEPAEGAVALSLDNSGTLQRISLRTGRVEASLAVTAAFECDAPVRPQLSLAPQRAFVTEPARGVIHDVVIPPLRQWRTYSGAGNASAIVVLGVGSATRNLAVGGAD